MRKPVKATPKHHPPKHHLVAVKAVEKPEKAEKPVHIAVKESGKTNNQELIDGLKRAKQQISASIFSAGEAAQATKWIDELIAKAS